MTWTRCRRPEASAYEIAEDGASITFRPCGVTSYHPKDVEHRFCAYCDEFIPEVFVFGSNLAGRHGKGAAEFARKERGAIYGQGVGRQGNSYAIPTKDAGLRRLTLAEINVYAGQFLTYAREHPKMRFQLTAIGTGYAGYTPNQIAWMFADAPPNVRKPPEFAKPPVRPA